jgi:hypothetical protein
MGSRQAGLQRTGIPYINIFKIMTTLASQATTASDQDSSGKRYCLLLLLLLLLPWASALRTKRTRGQAQAAWARPRRCARAPLFPATHASTHLPVQRAQEAGDDVVVL